MGTVDPIKMNAYKFNWRCLFGHAPPRVDSWQRLVTFQSNLNPGKNVEIAFYECGRCNKMQWHRATRKT